jgi:uncharacterized protein
LSTPRPTQERRPFIVEVAALRREPGSRRRVSIDAPLSGLENSAAVVPRGSSVHFDALLESVVEGILVTGTIRVPWEGSCRRCLERATGELVVELRELCSEVPDEQDETYPLEGDLLDLAPLVYDACILALPLAPLCSEECLGLCPECGANRNLEQCTCAAPLDPRWEALVALRDGEGERPEEKK